MFIIKSSQNLNLILMLLLSIIDLVFLQKFFCWEMTESLDGSLIVSQKVRFLTDINNDSLLIKADLLYNNTTFCSSTRDFLQLNNTCWNFRINESDWCENLEYIYDILGQLSELLKIFNQKYQSNYFQSLCFLGNFIDCTLRHQSQNIYHNFTTFLKDYPYTLYSSYHFHFTHDNLTFCLLPHKIFNIISCREEINYLEKTPTSTIYSFDENISQDITKKISCDMNKEKISQEIRRAYTISFGISLLFLGLFLLECVIISDLRKYPNCIIMFLSLQVFISRILFLVLQYIYFPPGHIGWFIIRSFYRAFDLGTYCWIAISGYDLWRTFTNWNAVPTKPLLLPNKRYRMLCYCLLVMFFSFVITTVECIISTLFDSPGDIYLHLSRTSCVPWINITEKYFFIIPRSTILLSNILCFVLTYAKVKASKHIVIQTSTEKKVNFVLWKLVILFGIPWVLTVVYSSIHIIRFERHFFYLAICLYPIETLFIFVLFGCRETFCQKLLSKIKILKIFI